MNPDGTSPMTFRGGGGRPAWSPDGTLLALACGPHGLCTAHADGTGLTTLATDSAHFPAWSPDGTRILFEIDRRSQGSDGPNLYSIGIDGSHLTTITAATCPRLREPGRLVAIAARSP
jgi:Tol biopolymer transport system component